MQETRCKKQDARYQMPETRCQKQETSKPQTLKLETIEHN